MLKLLKKVFSRKKVRSDIRGKAEPLSGGWEVLAGNWQKSNNLFNEVNDSALEAFYGVSIVYACINKIAVSINEAPLQIGKFEDGIFVQLDDKDSNAQSLLDNPNKFMSISEFLKHYITHLYLTGKSYTIEMRDQAGQIDEIFPVPSSWVTPISNRKSEIIGYEIFQGQDKSMSIPLENVTVNRLINPSNPHAGFGPIEASLKEIQIDDETRNYQMEMLFNMKMPGMIVKQSIPWTDIQKKEVRELLSDQIGRGKRGDPLFLSGENAELELQAPLKDFDFPSLSSLMETRVCATTGVPPILIGFRSGLERSTYANTEQAKKIFFENTMSPLWTDVAQAFRRGFIIDEGDDPELFFRFDLSVVKSLQDDVNERSERADKLFNGGLITRDEGRDLAGFEPDEGELGNVYRIKAGQIEVDSSTGEVNSNLLLPFERDTGENVGDGEDDDDEDEGNEE